MPEIDLYLGSDIGQWVLAQVSPEDVRYVVADSPELTAKAAASGFTTQPGPVACRGDVVFSVHYPRILTGRELRRYHRRYNLHPGCLPWGRGMYPVFWALWEQTSAGATLHEMVPQVDAGPVVECRQVPVAEHDTGHSLLQRVRIAEKQLFGEYWPRILAGEVLPSVPQEGPGTSHTLKEFHDLHQRADLSGMSAHDLVRLTRAMMFPGHPGPTINVGGVACELSLRPLEGTE